MNESLAVLHARLACLGPLSRFRLAVQLLAGERCVTDLAAAVQLSQSCTTRHLQAMTRDGLVQGTRAGKKVMFRLQDETSGLLALISTMMGETPAGAAAAAPSEAVARSRTRNAMTPVRRTPEESERERVRRSTPESDTPSAPAVAYRPVRSGDLEDFLL